MQRLVTVFLSKLEDFHFNSTSKRPEIEAAVNTRIDTIMEDNDIEWLIDWLIDNDIYQCILNNLISQYVVKHTNIVLKTFVTYIVRHDLRKKYTWKQSLHY